MSTPDPAAPRWTAAPLPVDGPDAADLLRCYFADLIHRYFGQPGDPAEVDEALAEEPSTDLAPPTGAFLTVREGPAAEPGGCVGVRLLSAEIAELTRLYVRPAARGRGAGSALLAAAEAEAVRLGRRRMRLDTRADLVEARALYARHGYVEIPRYNDSRYADHWFEKPLGG